MWTNSFQGCNVFPTEDLCSGFDSLCVLLCCLGGWVEVISATLDDVKERRHEASPTISPGGRFCGKNPTLHESNPSKQVPFKQQISFMTNPWDIHRLRFGKREVSQLSAMAVCMLNYLINLFRARAAQLFTGTLIKNTSLAKGETASALNITAQSNPPSFL